LQIAACKGFKATVGKLLERGADVNETNEGGESALGFGVLIGDTEMVRLLLDKVWLPTLRG
jgi:ankyrin repeat protein